MRDARVPIRVMHDPAVDAAYVALRSMTPGVPTEQVVVAREQGSVMLEFDESGVLLGVEIRGAAAMVPVELLGESREPRRNPT
jgi:uncharacterized protein YuzE